ncbi:uncharacterized protein EV422DRAFT_161288 [Fimicolochytrium jonesii]|uniref:uncharacterized protein n=1 Tax=Fimicolochytrium jonesii TaxID=1396493 RepID=UPI0022FEA505|nr:uncharacterized protein EV422DRAFT_161288 [Fimicolochytrium jonesii]KAI8826298.1 hypothetical protein EV422DRAFT_161288 [Fimicolochytrium jonesii]
MMLSLVFSTIVIVWTTSVVARGEAGFYPACTRCAHTDVACLSTCTTSTFLLQITNVDSINKQAFGDVLCQASVTDIVTAAGNGSAQSPSAGSTQNTGLPNSPARSGGANTGQLNPQPDQNTVIAGTANQGATVANPSGGGVVPGLGGTGDAIGLTQGNQNQNPGGSGGLGQGQGGTGDATDLTQGNQNQNPGGTAGLGQGQGGSGGQLAQPVLPPIGGSPPNQDTNPPAGSSHEDSTSDVTNPWWLSGSAAGGDPDIAISIFTSQRNAQCFRNNGFDLFQNGTCFYCSAGRKWVNPGLAITNEAAVRNGFNGTLDEEGGGTMKTRLYSLDGVTINKTLVWFSAKTAFQTPACLDIRQGEVFQIDFNFDTIPRKIFKVNVANNLDLIVGFIEWRSVLDIYMWEFSASQHFIVPQENREHPAWVWDAPAGSGIEILERTSGRCLDIGGIDLFNNGLNLMTVFCDVTPHGKLFLVDTERPRLRDRYLLHLRLVFRLGVATRACASPRRATFLQMGWHRAATAWTRSIPQSERNRGNRGLCEAHRTNGGR